MPIPTENGGSIVGNWLQSITGTASWLPIGFEAHGPIVAALAVGAMLAIWAGGRALAPFALIVPGVIAGTVSGSWLHAGLHWTALPALGIGLVVAWAMYQVAASFYLARLATAALMAPAALWALWLTAHATFALAWALAITVAAAATLGSLVVRYLRSEDRAFGIWLTDLIDDLRAD
jgi:hypothetical protein